MRIDPNTGDRLTTGEAVAWKVQWIIRRWVFLIGLTALTAAAWTYVALGVGWGLRAGPIAVLTWWNLGFSYLAVLIESIVGMSQFHQAQRDAVILRETRDTALVTRQAVNAIQAHTESIDKLCELIYEQQLRSESD